MTTFFSSKALPPTPLLSPFTVIDGKVQLEKGGQRDAWLAPKIAAKPDPVPVDL